MCIIYRTLYRLGDGCVSSCWSFLCRTLSCRAGRQCSVILVVVCSVTLSGWWTRGSNWVKNSAEEDSRYILIVHVIEEDSRSLLGVHLTQLMWLSLALFHIVHWWTFAGLITSTKVLVVQFHLESRSKKFSVYIWKWMMSLSLHLVLFCRCIDHRPHTCACNISYSCCKQIIYRLYLFRWYILGKICFRCKFQRILFDSWPARLFILFWSLSLYCLSSRDIMLMPLKWWLF